MQYHHSLERSTELLRQALPLMSRQSAALDPVSYALWYAYVADEHSPLRAEVDQWLAQHGKLDAATTLALYQRHLASPDSEQSQQVSDGLHQLIGSLVQQAAQADDHTQQYGVALQRAATALGGAPAANEAQAPDADADGPGALVGDLLRHTQQMMGHLSQLRRELAESQREINQLRTEVERARQESLADKLTGLANRRAFDQRLALGLRSAAADGPVSLLLADLDHFKRINDTYGHGFGDQVLRAVATLLRQAAPEGAMAARIGGEEFALLLPATPVEQAMALAERLRQAVASNRIRRKGQSEATERVTLSVGVACSRGGDRPQQLIDRADRALYAAKAGGRDQVMLDRVA